MLPPYAFLWLLEIKVKYDNTRCLCLACPLTCHFGSRTISIFRAELPV